MITFKFNIDKESDLEHLDIDTSEFQSVNVTFILSEEGKLVPTFFNSKIIVNNKIIKVDKNNETISYHRK